MFTCRFSPKTSVQMKLRTHWSFFVELPQPMFTETCVVRRRTHYRTQVHFLRWLCLFLEDETSHLFHVNQSSCHASCTCAHSDTITRGFWVNLDLVKAQLSMVHRSQTVCTAFHRTCPVTSKISCHVTVFVRAYKIWKWHPKCNCSSWVGDFQHLLVEERWWVVDCLA